MGKYATFHLGDSEMQSSCSPAAEKGAEGEIKGDCEEIVSEEEDVPPPPDTQSHSPPALPTTSTLSSLEESLSHEVHYTASSLPTSQYHSLSWASTKSRATVPSTDPTLFAALKAALLPPEPWQWHKVKRPQCSG
ncbi:unnamed protein product [Arctogadus glacialis]